jgi:hypothetical protein
LTGGLPSASFFCAGDDGYEDEDEDEDEDVEFERDVLWLPLAGKTVSEPDLPGISSETTDNFEKKNDNKSDLCTKPEIPGRSPRAVSSPAQLRNCTPLPASALPPSQVIGRLVGRFFVGSE